MRQARSSTATSNAAFSVSSSTSRPTSGASRRRATPAAPSITASSDQASTAAVLPLTVSGSRGSTTAALATSLRVASPSRISLGRAACSSRLATLTASPVTNVWPADGSPATTSPVLIPVRIWIVTLQSRSSSSFRRASTWRISTAARTARSASSSFRRGTPNTAMTASPMNFSTAPPCRRSTPLIASNQRDMTRRSDSGSSCSPRRVEPATSQNRTVTTFRAEGGAGAACASGAPQARQKFADGGFCSPHLTHAAISGV